MSNKFLIHLFRKVNLKEDEQCVDRTSISFEQTILNGLTTIEVSHEQGNDC